MIILDKFLGGADRQIENWAHMLDEAMEDKGMVRAEPEQDFGQGFGAEKPEAAKPEPKLEGVEALKKFVDFASEWLRNDDASTCTGYDPRDGGVALCFDASGYDNGYYARQEWEIAIEGYDAIVSAFNEKYGTDLVIADQNDNDFYVVVAV